MQLKTGTITEYLLFRVVWPRTVTLDQNALSDLGLTFSVLTVKQKDKHSIQSNRRLLGINSIKSNILIGSFVITFGLVPGTKIRVRTLKINYNLPQCLYRQ